MKTRDRHRNSIFVVSLTIVLFDRICIAASALTSTPSAFSQYQPSPNRECAQMMGAGTTLYTMMPPKVDEDVPNPSKPASLRDVCAELCLENEGACIGFNWPPTGTYCVLVSQGCSLTPSRNWIFYRKPRRLLIRTQNATSDGQLGIIFDGSSSQPVSTTTMSNILLRTGGQVRIQVAPTIDSHFSLTNITLNSSLISTSNNASLKPTEIPLLDSLTTALLGSHFDVFRRVICKLSLTQMLFVRTQNGVATCAELCLNSTQPCSGFNMPTPAEESAEDNAPFCQLLLEPGCESSQENGWYYFRRKSLTVKEEMTTLANLLNQTTQRMTLSTSGSVLMFTTMPASNSPVFTTKPVAVSSSSMTEQSATSMPLSTSSQHSWSSISSSRLPESAMTSTANPLTSSRPDLQTTKNPLETFTDLTEVPTTSIPSSSTSRDALFLTTRNSIDESSRIDNVHFTTSQSQTSDPYFTTTSSTLNEFSGSTEFNPWSASTQDPMLSTTDEPWIHSSGLTEPELHSTTGPLSFTIGAQTNMTSSAAGATGPRSVSTVQMTSATSEGFEDTTPKVSMELLSSMTPSTLSSTYTQSVQSGTTSRWLISSTTRIPPKPLTTSEQPSIFQTTPLPQLFSSTQQTLPIFTTFDSLSTKQSSTLTSPYQTNPFSSVSQGSSARIEEQTLGTLRFSPSTKPTFTDGSQLLTRMSTQFISSLTTETILRVSTTSSPKVFTASTSRWIGSSSLTSSSSSLSQQSTENLNPAVVTSRATDRLPITTPSPSGTAQRGDVSGETRTVPLTTPLVFSSDSLSSIESSTTAASGLILSTSPHTVLMTDSTKQTEIASTSKIDSTTLSIESKSSSLPTREGLLLSTTRRTLDTSSVEPSTPSLIASTEAVLPTGASSGTEPKPSSPPTRDGLLLTTIRGTLGTSSVEPSTPSPIASTEAVLPTGTSSGTESKPSSPPTTDGLLLSTTRVTLDTSSVEPLSLATFASTEAVLPTHTSLSLNSGLTTQSLIKDDHTVPISSSSPNWTSRQQTPESTSATNIAMSTSKASQYGQDMTSSIVLSTTTETSLSSASVWTDSSTASEQMSVSELTTLSPSVDFTPTESSIIRTSSQYPSPEPSGKPLEFSTSSMQTTTPTVTNTASLETRTLTPEIEPSSESPTMTQMNAISSSIATIGIVELKTTIPPETNSSIIQSTIEPANSTTTMQTSQNLPVISLTESPTTTTKMLSGDVSATQSNTTTVTSTRTSTTTPRTTAATTTTVNATDATADPQKKTSSASNTKREFILNLSVALILQLIFIAGLF